MQAHIESLLTWLALHPHWGGFFAFIIAFSECFAVLGLIIPGMLIMPAVGALIGTGILPAIPLFLWAIAGAVGGDALSYWIGYHYHSHVRDFWPFRTHPNILKRGETFFIKHGGKGVFFGRFLGPIRPILPIIAGMVSMPPIRFFLADIPSAVIWAPLYMLPGILVGAASQQLPPETATKLLLYAAVLLGLLGFISWLLKRIYSWLSKLLDRLVAWLWQLTERYPNFKLIRAWLTDPLDPQNHKQLGLVLLLLIAIILFIVLAYNTKYQGSLTALNYPVYYFLRSIRTTFVDHILVAITLFAPRIFMLMWATLAFTLALQRNWRAMWHWIALGLLVVGSSTIIKHLIHSARPTGLFQTPIGFSFPSGHATASVGILGFFAVLITRGRSLPWRWTIYSLVSLLTISIIFSRIYLGAHWLTDVIGGALLGSICFGLVTLSYRRHATLLHNPNSLLLIALLTLSAAWSYKFHNTYQPAIRAYTPYWQTQVLDAKAWWQRTDEQTPLYRMNRFGKPIEILNVQWAGDIFAIEDTLIQQGWKSLPSNPFMRAIKSLTSGDRAEQLPVLSQLYEDRKPILTMSKVLEPEHKLLVLQLWDGHLSLDDGTPLWLGSIHYQKSWNVRFHKKKASQLSYLPNASLILAKDLTAFKWKQEVYKISPHDSAHVLYIQPKH